MALDNHTEVPEVKTKSCKHESVANTNKYNFLEFSTEILWKNVIMFAYIHIFAFYGMYLMLFQGSWKTMIWTFLLVEIGHVVGMTAGIHRLWSHRAYKANTLLRIIYMVCATVAFQKTIYDWARDHRVHHKYTHTDADPHNPERGHFFSHIGCLMLKKHKDVVAKGKCIDVSDLEADPVVKFQYKYWWYLAFIFAFLVPVMVPRYFWRENWLVCLFTPTFFRVVWTLHRTLFVNSIAHAWGTKPYDKYIGPVENPLAAFLTSGEGWHNYHHVFPWDYKSGELGGYALNTTTLVIDFFAALGWAYDLKTASVEMVNKRKNRTGDNTGTLYHSFGNHFRKAGLWGWGDDDMNEEEVNLVKVYNNVQEAVVNNTHVD